MDVCKQYAQIHDFGLVFMVLNTSKMLTGLWGNNETFDSQSLSFIQEYHLSIAKDIIWPQVG